MWLRHSHSLHHQSALWCLSASPRTPAASLPLLPPLPPLPKCLAEGEQRQFRSLAPSAVQRSAVKDTPHQPVTLSPVPVSFPALLVQTHLTGKGRGKKKRAEELLSAWHAGKIKGNYMFNAKHFPQMNFVSLRAPLCDPLPQLYTGSTSCLQTPEIGNALALRACSIHSFAVYPLSHPFSHPLSLSLSSPLSAAAVEGRLAHE